MPLENFTSLWHLLRTKQYAPVRKKINARSWNCKEILFIFENFEEQKSCFTLGEACKHFNLFNPSYGYFEELSTFFRLLFSWNTKTKNKKVWFKVMPYPRSFLDHDESTTCGKQRWGAHILSHIYDPLLTLSTLRWTPPSGDHLREKIDHPGHFDEVLCPREYESVRICKSTVWFQKRNLVFISKDITTKYFFSFTGSQHISVYWALAMLLLGIEVECWVNMDPEIEGENAGEQVLWIKIYISRL